WPGRSPRPPRARPPRRSPRAPSLRSAGAAGRWRTRSCSPRPRWRGSRATRATRAASAASSPWCATAPASSASPAAPPPAARRPARGRPSPYPLPLTGGEGSCSGDLMTTRWPEARAPRGMVATPHLLATQSGLAALRAGGNALDAAIAAAATIAVVYPHMNGLGGDNVWLIYDAGRQRLRALCAVGRAARAATIDWYAARGVTAAIPARGGLASLTVPAVVDGWWQAHKYSRETMGSPITWSALLSDAIQYAREGFQASDGQRIPPPREPDLFTERAPEEIRRGLWPLYHPDSLRRGPLVQRDLARTLEAARDGGAEGFYRGDVARRLVAAAAAAGSPLTIEDLAEHRSDWMEPLRMAYAEGQVASFPPPTQGISALAVLAMTERFDMSALPEADYIHVLVEATKLAFDDRDRYLTDPAHMRVNPADLLTPERLEARARLISRERARPPQPAAPAGGDTIALVTADREGNAVSLIQSLYFTFGSAVLAGDTGVVLQNRGSFFSLDPRHVNALAPGKRTMHTLIP